MFFLNVSVRKISFYLLAMLLLVGLFGTDREAVAGTLDACTVEAFYVARDPETGGFTSTGESPPRNFAEQGEEMAVRLRFIGECPINYPYEFFNAADKTRGAYDNGRTIADARLVQIPNSASGVPAIRQHDYGNLFPKAGVYQYTVRVYNPADPTRDSKTDQTNSIQAIAKDPIVTSCNITTRSLSANKIDNVGMGESIKFSIDFALSNSCIQSIRTTSSNYSISYTISLFYGSNQLVKDNAGKPIDFESSDPIFRQNIDLIPSKFGKKGEEITFYYKVVGNIYSSDRSPILLNQRSSDVTVGIETKVIDQAAGKLYGCVNQQCTAVDSTNFSGPTVRGDSNCGSLQCAKTPTGGDPKNNGGTSGTGGTVEGTFKIENPLGSGYDSLEDLVNAIGRWIFRLAIPAAVLVILYAGFLMLTAGATNPANFTKGKTALTYAVIGLAVILIGRGFISLIKSILQLRG